MRAVQALQGSLPPGQVEEALHAAERAYAELPAESIASCSVDDLRWALAVCC